jgi:photosystem II stability/assembly factor-like uncharacterized protein
VVNAATSDQATNGTGRYRPGMALIENGEHRAHGLLFHHRSCTQGRGVRVESTVIGRIGIVSKEGGMAEFETFVGSRDGVYRLGGSGLEECGLKGQRVWAIHAWRGREPDGRTTVLAGTYGDGIMRSDDGGQTWEPSSDGLTATALRCIQPDPTRPGALLCGTEPARAFRSEDGGRSWQELDGIHQLEGYQEWYLPYSPRAGALRNLYSPPGQVRRLLGAVEVGGLLDSRDAGETWSYLDVSTDQENHYITGHPDDGDMHYAALGLATLRHLRETTDRGTLSGVGRSRDGGRSWQKIQHQYTRAVIVPPTRPDLLLAAPSLQVGHGGRIEVSADGGDSWEAAGEGFESPMEVMVEVFVPAPDGTIWAVCSGGRLMCAEPGEWQWRSALHGAEIDAQSVAFVTPG